ncbi:surf-like protein [Phialemonium atrogriseum]|uniref:SURF1-like protein n=1 Tax=Phialemonium atrogriseum TaxID=1093897 RepID=A0AAJ0C2M1_9PEZI|nr:surf-like protein [Phialemonium atrogriseum]KAK1768781.1 surf-like protein [Phialemonium atrogriseum]
MKLVGELFRSLQRQRTTNFLRSRVSKPFAYTPTVRPCRTITSSPRRSVKQAADDPSFSSIVDNPPELVRSGRRHGPGLIILAIIPLTAFVLGSWQVQRLKWKTDLIAKCEDRLSRPPLPLPPQIDPSAVADFDYRRVLATGRFRYDREMLIGPRMRDGEAGYMVVTPLERDDGGSTVLVNRGWIAKDKGDQQARPDSLPTGEVRVEGLLREPWKKNMFTPDNRPDKGEFYFPDVEQMASLTGSQPVWIEQTMHPSILQVYDYVDRGIPIGRPAEVNLRNNHAQYIFTWYGLAVATSIMFYMVAKKPPTDVARRVRMNKTW